VSTLAHAGDGAQSLRLLRLAALLGQNCRVLGPLREFGDHRLRQCRRQPCPALRKQVDEQLLAGLHGIGRESRAQAEAQPPPVGIDPRHADIVGQSKGNVGQQELDRLGELHRQHAVLGLELVFGKIQALGEAQDETRKAVFLAYRQLGPVCRECANGKQQGGHQGHPHPKAPGDIPVPSPDPPQP
jgi:hypothetical protein